MREKELESLRERADELDSRIRERLARLGEDPDLSDARELFSLAKAIKTLTDVKRDLYGKPPQPERERQKIARRALEKNASHRSGIGPSESFRAEDAQ